VRRCLRVRRERDVRLALEPRANGRPLLFPRERRLRIARADLHRMPERRELARDRLCHHARSQNRDVHARKITARTVVQVDNDDRHRRGAREPAWWYIPRASMGSKVVRFAMATTPKAGASAALELGAFFDAAGLELEPLFVPNYAALVDAM